MSVEIFSKKDFEEKALPVHKLTGDPLWEYLGIRDGEHSYVVPIQNDVGIEIRSSIGTDGYSAPTGEDSIRCWLTDQRSGKPMGSKISRWTTRVAGWGDRTKEVIRQLWTMGKKCVQCPLCIAEGDTRLRCFKVKKVGPNKGRLFMRCPMEDCKYFKWCDIEEDGEVKSNTIVKCSTIKVSVELNEALRGNLECFLKTIDAKIV